MVRTRNKAPSLNRTIIGLKLYKRAYKKEKITKFESNYYRIETRHYDPTKGKRKTFESNYYRIETGFHNYSR